MAKIRSQRSLSRLPRRAVLRMLARAGYGLTALDAPNPYPFSVKQFEVAARLSGSQVLELLPHCHGKDGQDLFAAALNDFKPGFFVDIGAYDGRTGSNTHLLEIQLGWNGLLVEPNPECHPELQAIRSATLDTRAIGSANDEWVTLELDGQKSRIDPDGRSQRRHGRRPQASRTATVRTATVGAIFEERDVPEHVNYVSIDVEGLESIVIRGLPFGRHTIDLISVEHNYDTARRAEIRTFLANHDYLVAHEALSRNEDWFVRRALADHPAVVPVLNPA